MFASTKSQNRGRSRCQLTQRSIAKFRDIHSLLEIIRASHRCNFQLALGGPPPVHSTLYIRVPEPRIPSPVPRNLQPPSPSYTSRTSNCPLEVTLENFTTQWQRIGFGVVYFGWFGCLSLVQKKFAMLIDQLHVACNCVVDSASVGLLNQESCPMKVSRPLNAQWPW